MFVFAAFLMHGLSTACAAQDPATNAAAGAGAGAGAAASDLDQVLLAGQVELQQLVDLAAQRLDLDVQYDRAVLQGVTVTLRLTRSVGDEDLWSLTNQLLASRGLTSIHVDRTEAAAAPPVPPVPPVPAIPPPRRPVFNIVKVADAAALARLEQEMPRSPAPGFVSLVLPVRNRPLKDIVDTAKILISKPSGAIQELPARGAILVSDFRPRVEQIVEIVGSMDDPGNEIRVERIEARYVAATSLVALATAAVTAGSALSAQAAQGKLAATPDESAMVLVAPANEHARWRELIDRFDRPSGVEARTYVMGSFTLEEVARLIEDTARDRGPRGSGDRWRMVSDPLGGLLIVTATPAEHDQIAMVVNRLTALPPEARRPVRAFPIHNRSVSEVVEVLTKMLEAGVLEGAEFTSGVPHSQVTSPSRMAPELLQRSPPSTATAMPPGGSIEGATTAPSQVPESPTAPSGETTRRDGSSHIGPQRQVAGLTLTADEGTNTLIAVGEPRRLAQLEELLRTIDVRQPQVMVEVLVVSLNEGDTLDLGVELEKIEISGDTVITLSSLFGLMPPGTTAPTGKGFSGLILNPGDFRILIRALQTLNEGRALNMPRVLVNNNQQANLDAVVQQPFVSTNASDTVATTSFGGFENAGTTITVRPQIAKGDHLILEYSVSLSAFVGESSDPGVPPPRQQNNLQSVVTIPDGYTVVVGGIEVELNADAVSQVPLIGDIPFIGEAFKSRSRSSSRSRFFVFIRPTVLRQEGFEDLKYLSDVATRAAQVDDGFPEVEPRIIK